MSTIPETLISLFSVKNIVDHGARQITLSSGRVPEKFHESPVVSAPEDRDFMLLSFLAGDGDSYTELVAYDDVVAEIESFFTKDDVEPPTVEEVQEILGTTSELQRRMLNSLREPEIREAMYPTVEFDDPVRAYITFTGEREFSVVAQTIQGRLIGTYVDAEVIAIATIAGFEPGS